MQMSELSKTSSSKVESGNPQVYSSDDDKIKFCGCCMLSTKTVKVLKVTLLASAILIAVMIFLAILIATHVERKPADSTTPEQVNSTACSGLTSCPPDFNGSGEGVYPLISSCNDKFYILNDICRPKCTTFESYAPEDTALVVGSQQFASSFGVFIGLIVLIISIFRWRVMITFPSAFLICSTISYCVPSIFILISQADYSGLLCSSIDLFDTITNPTTYCTVTGVVFHYFFLSTVLWWFFHVVSIFYKVMFPVFAKSHQRKEKHVHLFLFVVGITAPILGVILCLSVSDWNYTLPSFPAFLCAPRNSNLWYYSTMLPLNIALLVGVCCLILMFWKVHKHQGQIFHHNKSPMTTAETKILFVLCYNVIFGVVVLIYYGFSTIDQEHFTNGLTSYFQCKAMGQRPNATCDPSLYQRYIYPELAVSSNFLSAFITTANLVFVINWNATKDRVMSCFRGKISSKTVVSTLDSQ